MRIFKLIAIAVIASFFPKTIFAAYGEEDYIGDVRTVQVWYVVYDIEGNRIGSISNQEGELVGFSDQIIVLSKFNFYYFYNTELERYMQKAKDSIGEIISVQSNGFIAERNGRRIRYNIDGEEVR